MKQWLWDNLRSLMGVWFVTLQAKIVGIFTKLMLALGLGWVAQETLMPAVKASIAPYFMSVPVAYQELVGALNIDKAATMILSALVVKYGSSLIFSGKSSWLSHS